MCISKSAAAGALLLLCVSCAGQRTEQMRPAALMTASERVLPRAACPSSLADVVVLIVETPAGIAVEFRTEGDAAEVYRRVERLAAAHNDYNLRAREALSREASRRSIAAALPPGVESSEVFEPSGPGDPNAGMDTEGPDVGNEVEPRGSTVSVVIPTSARATRLRDGGRLLLTPHDPNNLGKLRAAVRRRAGLLKMGECPVLG